MKGASGDKTKAAKLLWAAVAKGNTQAERELAGLYARGQGGVPKNCEQARVLLVAASAPQTEAAQLGCM
ncbi:MAG: hypothetical protein NVS9B4_16200 [Candidatus Acidiferrum sp.]